MTCAAPVGRRKPGCWGGLAVLGNAPAIDSEGAETELPGWVRAAYGGDDPDDTSGTLRFVRVEFAGSSSEGEVPSAALGFYGVGSGTTIDHVQAHASLGDGIQFRGGTAHCRFCVSSGAGDDSLEWSGGWLGTAQHVFLQQGPGRDSGIEASGPGAVRSASGRPALYNATLVGGASIGADSSNGDGLRLREGAALTARNLVVIGFGGYALAAGSDVAGLFVGGGGSIRNAILYENGGRYGVAQIEEGISPYIEFLDEDPQLRNVRYEGNPDPRPEDRLCRARDEGCSDPALRGCPVGRRCVYRSVWRSELARGVDV